MSYDDTTKNKIRRYADSAKTTLVFAHGVQTTEQKFVVRSDQVIVFMAPIGAKLSTRSMTRRAYEIFSNSQLIKDYVTGTLPRVPEFMKGWASRTYGPGTRCPNLWIDFKDPNWPAMGVLKLPLRGLLRKYSPKIATSLVHLVGTTNVVRDPVHYGTQAWLSDVTKDIKGLVFVIACRHVETRGTKVNDKALVAHEQAQKLLKRKRLSENNAHAKKQKTRNSKLENAEKRKKLLAKLEALKKRIRRS
jgi:hypothetical protein